ncbi:MAG TPA: GntR family transcriptional regulator [Gemmatimonadaceae bacterium]|nr:GntR family transcriptional regulator [Gemmatimonadaceae bacterium]
MARNKDVSMPRTGRAAVASALRDYIVAGLHMGRLRGGDRLPSIRTLAAEHGVNERVVLAALRELASEGFIELRPRSGAYVVGPQPASGETLPHLAAWLVGMLVQARTRGLAPTQVAAFVRRGMETRRVRAACIECNADQLHLLCTELTEDHGYAAESTPLADLDAKDPPLKVRRADVLITTAFHADAVGRIAKRIGKPWIAVSLRPDLMRDLARYLRAGPVYWIATDPKFERKLRGMVSHMEGAANLRVLLVGRDSIDDVPAHAPTFVMTSARERLRPRFGASGGPGRPFHPPRQFSDESARELLTFVVRANIDALGGTPL